LLFELHIDGFKHVTKLSGSQSSHQPVILCGFDRHVGRRKWTILKFNNSRSSFLSMSDSGSWRTSS
jgi:hypothetical protein